MKRAINYDLEKILFDEVEIENQITELGKTLSIKYTDKNPILISILKGSFIFMSDLMRKMTIPLEIDFMSISSYGLNRTSTGKIIVRKDISREIEGRDIIIVEDIVDTGHSIKFLKEHLSQYNPKSMITCTLLNKQIARKVDVEIEYSIFEVDDVFLVGYGLDYAEKYRNLPYMGRLKEEKIK
jgi:hypoxanthine phosphoribosyltransferase